MKFSIIIILLSSVFNFSKPDNKDMKLSNTTRWDKIVLRNEAKFKNREELNYGSSFLIKLDTGIIACTARDFTGTHYTHGEMLKIKDFPNELISWKMFLLNSPSDFVSVKSIALEERIEKRKFIFYYSRPFLTFSIGQYENSIKALEPDVNLIKNKDTVYIVGYGIENKINIVKGVVETWNNSKHADLELRIRTEQFLDHWNYVGSPIVNEEGKVIGVFNRAYGLKKDKKGRIISDSKNSANSSYDYFVNGTTMRLILGKNYGK